MRERSSITPMKTKSGTATSTSLFITPQKRVGSALRKFMSNTPSIQPSQAKNSEMPPNEKATGKPSINSPTMTANNPTDRISPRRWLSGTMILLPLEFPGDQCVPPGGAYF
jgi:hypothetical protein